MLIQICYFDLKDLDTFKIYQIIKWFMQKINIFKMFSTFQYFLINSDK